MPVQWDFALYRRDGRLAALVEAKARRGVSDIWAKEFRSNLLEDDPALREPMFVIATPRVIYVWNARAPLDDLPTYEVAGSEVFAGYFASAGVSQDDFIDPQVFELIVSRWLNDLAHGEGRNDILASSGFTDAVRGGRVVAQAAA